MSAGSSPAVRTLLLPLALAACGQADRGGPLVASVVGGPPRLADAARAPVDLPSTLLIDSVAQGLVRFDAAGQIEPGLAERWAVTDGGRDYIFRLREAHWSDGSAVTAEQVVDRLTHQLAPTSRNPLKPFLTAIEEIVVMTPQVVEVRLGRPRPDLLKLFAQPELAIIRRTRPAGTGPLQIVAGGASPLLRQLPDPDAPDDAPSPERLGEVSLTGEGAARSVARFVAGGADLVAGGSFADWPLVQAAGVSAVAVRIDPAAGLFGLAIVAREGFLADPANRAAVAQAIDRAAAMGAVANGWAADARLLPDRLDSAAPPQIAAWEGMTADQRRGAARAQVRAWQTPVTLRIALPDGPGATRLWGAIAADLLAVGITPVRTTATAPADLRLVDVVAPYDSARWYLATACQPCSEQAQAALEAARQAPTLAERAQHIAEADAALATDVAFIPLARPWRWALVGPRVQLWQPNTRAWHPLNRLLPDPT
ncbi:ABC transporter substrate-binding protein [Sphingomonas sp.]|uniref:ABC transporter substrate-binding protein n=1 Tax=Sphingomonas sp. TaxID=28214 RepID=UPI003CC6A4A4